MRWSTLRDIDEDIIDGLTREVYQLRSRSPQEMTDERWERIKVQFPGSVRICRQQAELEAAQMFADDDA